MSKKRKKRNTQSKKPNRNRKQPNKRQQNSSNSVSIHKIKTFFIGVFSNIKSQAKKLEFKKIGHTTFEHMKKNKNGYLFGITMALIVTIGYFTIVYESENDKMARLESQNVVSVDLSANVDDNDFMSNVEDQVNQIQDSEDVVVALDEPEQSVEVVETTTEPENIPVAESVDRITANTVTETSEMKAAAPTFRSIEDSMMLGIDMYAIVVDGVEKAYFKTEGEAYVIINDLKREFSVAGAVEERIVFQEEISVEKVKKNVLDFNGFQTTEEAFEFIKKGTNEQRIHDVVSGENPWTIAHNYGLSVDNLLDANPDIDPLRLQIGAKLSLIVPEPIINVVTITTIQRIDPIPFGKGENVPTDSYYDGEYRVKVSGKLGEAENVLEQYSINGRLIGEKTISSDVITEPTDQISWAGTKPVPPKQGTGTWKNPTSRGYITSGFGSRSLGYHNGIDIGLPMRSDVKAADGGTVIFADYKGTYGKLVMIDHGENKISYYAHNDKLLVTSGQRVAQGTLIALSGSTGRSTGPHLHFEVRINGQAVNPRRFVNY